ncbi:hypothetical protein [Dechloromonas sp.]|uniref:hypothetical protein n=1 Tax=Dechloromonas sp. TaxID=1917218 RepID=UPI0021747752|nr:hypothetical protein [Dechloromonas sp.]MBU3696837.1 hypothetical protein [Dechloromonas sp.]
MSKKRNPIQKSNRHTSIGSSTNYRRQQPKLTVEELDGIRGKLSPYTHNPLIRRLYVGLIPN